MLAEVKHDEKLCLIPVVVLTTSKAEEDILRSYQLNANAFVSKPVDFSGLVQIVRAVENFWFSVVVLPPEVKEA